MKALNKMLGRGKEGKSNKDGSTSSRSVLGSFQESHDDVHLVDKHYSVVENRNKEGPNSPSVPSVNRSIQKGKGNVDRLVALNENDKRLLAARKQVVFSRKKRGECLLQKGVSHQ